MRYVFIFLLSVTPLYGSTSISLKSAFELALNHDESLHSDLETINQNEERYWQAVGTVLPTVSVGASYLVQQNVQSSSVSPSEQPLSKISLTQPIFRGFREFHALRYQNAQTEISRKNLERNRELLFLDVAQNYLTILSMEKELSNIDEQIAAYHSRANELRSRMKIGRSRATELLSLESSQSVLQVQKRVLTGQLQVARKRLTSMTRLPHDCRLEELEVLPTKLPAEETYLTKLDERPDRIQSRIKLSAAEESISIAQGAHWPSIDFGANYYIVRQGFLQDVKWDAQVTITLPLFNGGILIAKTNEARSQKLSAEWEKQKIDRTSELEVRSLLDAVNADLEQLKELKQALEINRRNYEEQTKDYRYSLVTNLDVLSALAQYTEARRTYDRARYTAQLDLFRLNVAAHAEPLLNVSQRK